MKKKGEDCFLTFSALKTSMMERTAAVLSDEGEDEMVEWEDEMVEWVMLAKVESHRDFLRLSHLVLLHQMLPSHLRLQMV